MSKKGTLRQILENEADKKAVEYGFKQIDEAAKTFQVRHICLSDYKLAHLLYPA